MEKTVKSKALSKHAFRITRTNSNLFRKRRSLSFALFLDLEFLTKDGSNFALHKSPGYVRTCQGTFFAAGTVYFVTVGSTLALDALARTRETEFVMRY